MKDAEPEWDYSDPDPGNLERISGDPDITVIFPDGHKDTVCFDEPVIRVAYEAPLKPDDIRFDLFRIGSNAIDADVHRMSLKGVLLEFIGDLDEGIREGSDINAEAIAESLEGLAKAIRARSSKA